MCLEFSAPVIVIQTLIEQYDEDEDDGRTVESTIEFLDIGVSNSIQRETEVAQENSTCTVLDNITTSQISPVSTVHHVPNNSCNEKMIPPCRRSSTSSTSGGGLISMPDINNRYPLHHAAIHAADEDTIRYLYQSYPPAATKLDISGNTPLMLASFTCTCSKPSAVAKAKKCVEALIVICPKALLVEDNEGLTAIESFLFSDDDESSRRKRNKKMVMDLLQGYTAKYVMQRRERQKKRQLGITSRNMKCSPDVVDVTEVAEVKA